MPGLYVPTLTRVLASQPQGPYTNRTFIEKDLYQYTLPLTATPVHVGASTHTYTHQDNNHTDTDVQPIQISYTCPLADVATVDVAAMRSLVETFTQVMVNAAVFKVDMSQYRLSRARVALIFTPVLASGSPVYRTFADAARLMTVCNLHYLQGYQALSTDPLTAYALQTLRDDGIFMHKGDIRVVEGVVVVATHRADVVDTINKRILDMRQNGYVAFAEPTVPSSSYAQEYALYPRIAAMMNITRVDANISQVYRTDMDMGMSVDTWMSQAAHKLLQGQLPLFVATGWWQDGLFEEPSDMTTTFSKGGQRAKLLLAVTKAYVRTIQSNPQLKSSLDQLRLYDDYSVGVPITSVDDVAAFKQYLREAVAGIDVWTVVTAATATEAMYQDATLRQLYPQLNTLMLPYRGQYYVVVDSTVDNIPEARIMDRTWSDADITATVKANFSAQLDAVPDVPIVVAPLNQGIDEELLVAESIPVPVGLKEPQYDVVVPALPSNSPSSNSPSNVNFQSEDVMPLENGSDYLFQPTLVSLTDVEAEAASTFLDGEVVSDDVEAVGAELKIDPRMAAFDAKGPYKTYTYHNPTAHTYHNPTVHSHYSHYSGHE